MKASELVDLLDNIIAENGDLEVLTITADCHNDCKILEEPDPWICFDTVTNKSFIDLTP